jgi:hypothetical protein
LVLFEKGGTYSQSEIEYYDKMVQEINNLILESMTTRDNNNKTKDKAVTVIRTPFANRTEATKAGQTKLNSLKRKKQTMKITVLGDPTIKAERALELINTRRPFPVNWLTSLVKHTISKQGFVTEIDCELPTAKDSKVGVVSQALKDKVAASREGNVKFNNTTGKYDIVKPDSTKINNKK